MSNDWNNAEYLNLSTQKRDGSWVDTPVWFAPDITDTHGKTVFYVFSEGKAWKVKRIRNFSGVKVCPCGVTGSLQGEWQQGEAEILDANEQTTAYQSLRSKYGWKLWLLDIGSRLAGKINKRAFIRITLS